MNITLYGLFSFDRGAKARWLLSELNIDAKTHWLDQDAKEIESESYLQVNPLGRIPAMKINDKSMFDSGAIVAYLADRHLAGNLAPALDAPERMEYQQWMYFAATTVDHFSTRIMIIEDIPAGELHDQKLEPLMTEFKDSVTFLNETLSKHDYLVSSGFTAADICVSYHLYFIALWPEFKELINAQPHLSAYLKRMQERPAAIKADVFSYEG